MDRRPSPLPSPVNPWLDQLFGSPATRRGGLLRTTLRDVEQNAGLDRFCREVHARGFRALENAGQIIVFCNRDPVAILRSPASGV